MELIVTAVVTGLGGAFTPCTLGVNLFMVQFLAGKPSAVRVRQWVVFAVLRAVLLTSLGMLIGLLGQLVTSFAWWFQIGISLVIVAAGVAFILGRNRPLLPGFDLAGRRLPAGAGSAAGLGILFGMNITACIAPLVLALLGATVLAGKWFLGAIALFLFGLMLSVPILAAVFSRRAAEWITAVSREYRTAVSVVVGGILIVLGAAEIWLSLMAVPWA